MPLFHSAVKLIKELCGGEQAVQIIYEDQATNDFKSLFMRLNGKFPVRHFNVNLIVIAIFPV